MLIRSWCLLADLASYKPTLLPDDNPADFHYFFDSGQRRRCYVAPERFLGTSSDRWANRAQARLKPSMDIFSCGCLIAEIFLEGEPLFDLPQLLAYKARKYEPAVLVTRKLSNRAACELVTHMIQLEPSHRHSASTYLREFAGRLFPSAFERLYEFMATLQTPLMPPERKIATLRNQYEALIAPLAPATGHRSAQLLRTFFDDDMMMKHVVKDEDHDAVSSSTGPAVQASPRCVSFFFIVVYNGILLIINLMRLVFS